MLMENYNLSKLDLAYDYALFTTDAHEKIQRQVLSTSILDKPSKEIFDLINNFKNFGNQAQKIYKAYYLFKKMIEDKDAIMLSFTSNVASSSKEYINFLIKNKIIKGAITTCGAFEEDIMNDLYKSHFSPEEDFWSEGSIKDDIKLKKIGINRAGNILIPNKFYTNLWEDVSDRMSEFNFPQEYSFCDLFKKITSILPLSDNSIFKVLTIHNVPFFIPAPTDGAIGDFILFQKKYNNKYYNPSLSKDYIEMADLFIENQDNISVIILGAGVSKHHTLLHSVYGRGAKRAIYINTSSEYDNSDAGGSPGEAITWGKIKTDGEFVKVFSEVSTCFPLIVEAIRYEFNII